MEFFGQEHWSGLPCPPAGDLPDPGIELTSLMFPALAGGFFTTRAIWEVPEPALDSVIWVSILQRGAEAEAMREGPVLGRPHRVPLSYTL